MHFECDECGKQVDGEMYTVRLPRPSDPSDLCAILATCRGCAGQIGAKSEAYWDEYIESPEAVKAGHYWLT